MVGFLVAGMWGIVFVGILAFLTAAFVVVPLPTFSLTNYLQNVFQIVFFVFATLISHKVFSVHQSEFYGFFKSFNTQYVAEGTMQDPRMIDGELNEDPFDTAGRFTAHVALNLGSQN